MEAREELRLFRAGFRPVSRAYMLAALLAAMAAMTAELWTVQLHATRPEACFKPWRSSLTFALHAFLAVLRLLRSSASKLCSYYGKYRVCVGLVSLLLISYLFSAIMYVVVTASSQGLIRLMDNYLYGKYIVEDYFDPVDELAERRSNFPIATKKSPDTLWRYVGESARFSCKHSFGFHSGLEFYDDDIHWIHNGRVIRSDDPRYEMKHVLHDDGPSVNGLHSYSLSSELRVSFITQTHFGAYDCAVAWYLDYSYQPPSAEKYPRSLQVFDGRRRLHQYNFNTPEPSFGEDKCAQGCFERIGRVHLSQIMPQKRLTVVPVGGVMVSLGVHKLLSDLDPSLVSFEYRVNGKDVQSFVQDYEDKQLRRSPLILVDTLYKYIYSIAGLPYFDMRNWLSSYSLHYALHFPYVPFGEHKISPLIWVYTLYKYMYSIPGLPYFDMRNWLSSYSLYYALQFPFVPFGEHKIIFYVDLRNYTTGMTEMQEVEYPVTFIFKPSPPLLMDIYNHLLNISGSTLNDSDPFVAATANLCLGIEIALLYFVSLGFVMLAMWLVKQTVLHVLVPIWHATFLLGFQRPSRGTLADICVTEPQESELRYDVFVSYAWEDPEDRTFVHQELLPKLQRLGLSVCLPERERAPNETELRGTSCLVQACTFYIVVVTPSYIDCAICNRLELPFILSRFQHREVDDHQVVLVKLRACIIPGGLRCSLPVVDLTCDTGHDQLDDVIRGWTPRSRPGRSSFLSTFL